MVSEKFEDMDKDELYEEAQRLDIDGRSTMDKAELLAAVQAADGSDGSGEESTDTTQAEESPVTDGAAVDTEAALVNGPDKEENGGFHVDSGAAERSGPIAGDTDTDPVLDSEADYSEPEVEYVQDTNTVKSIREEIDEQNARREAADAQVEETIKQAGQTPY